MQKTSDGLSEDSRRWTVVGATIGGIASIVTIALQLVAPDQTPTFIRLSSFLLLLVCVASAILAGLSYRLRVKVISSTASAITGISAIIVVALTPNTSEIASGVAVTATPPVSTTASAPQSNSPQSSTPPTLAQQTELEFVQTEVKAANWGDSPNATVDLTIRNSGSKRAALTALEITILDFKHVEGCSCGGDVPITGKYDIKLPENPKVGQKITMVLHQQIGPDALDRILVRFAGPKGNGKGSCTSAESFVYLVEIGIAQDGDRPTVSMGRYLIETKNAIIELNHYLGVARKVTPDDAVGNTLCSSDDQACIQQQCDCWNRNRNSLLKLFAPGVHLSEGAQNARKQLVP